MKLYKKPIIENILFISGLTRSGKALLCPIISGFNNTEKVSVNFFLEQIPTLNYLGEINTHTSKFLLRSGMNRAIYDNAIGRNANFRPDDFTSVWKNKNPMEYVKRLSEPDGDEVLLKLNSQNKIYPMMVHNGLWHSKIWFNAFPSLKFIHMQRNPIEIIYSWIGKGYGGSFYNSPRSDIVTFNYKGEILPYYAFGWEKEWLGLKDVDRIIFMVNHIRNCHQESYNQLDKELKKRILFIKHKSITSNPDESLLEIANFIGESASTSMPNILLQENCPRVIEINEFSRKTLAIKKGSSKKAFDLLMLMHNQFESEHLGI